MPELRYDPLKGNWILLAQRRRKRPIRLQILHRADEVDCPFCAGKEHLTPKEIWAYREEGKPNGPGWKIRVVPNKYPALSPHKGLSSSVINETFIKRVGYGFHEIILETPKHDQDLPDLEREHLFLVLFAYRERMRSLYKKKGIKYVQIFRNWGPLAGASLAHPHTQILALPQIPDIPQRELKNMREGRILCKMLKDEKKDGKRLLIETKTYSAFVPFAARFAYEIIIIPKEHQPDFRDCGRSELHELGGLLQKLLRAIKNLLGNISYNLVLHSLPEPDFHWHIEITPRIAGWAGFELGTGYFINTVPPEEAGKNLRNVLKKGYL